MRFKDLFFPLALALLVTAGIQFFWGAKVEEKAQTARLHEIAHQVEEQLQTHEHSLGGVMVHVEPHIN